MSDFIFFLGRFHVLVLHLPIGILLLTLVLDWLARRPRYHFLTQVLPVCWGAMAITAILTVILGLMHVAEGGFEGPSVAAHRNFGISVAVASAVIWFLAASLPALYRQVRIAGNLVLVFLVAMTGHYGGNLTHGPTYLVEYAPQLMRNLAGLEPRRPPVTVLAQADPWRDVVAPMLQTRCGSCHNADKQRGQLDMSSLDALLVGGESGAVVLVGNAEGSDLYRRITLPETHDNFMPAEGKTPLTGDQVDILRWWIDAGLPADLSLGELDLAVADAALLAGALGLGAPSAGPAVTAYPAVAESGMDAMVNAGWLVRPLQQDSNGLVVSIRSVGQPVSREMLAALTGAGDSIVELNLSSSGLYDDLLGELGDMSALENLNLGNNGITDTGLESLAGYSALTVLNLYGNPAVTDVGLAHLGALENLETLYLWGTGTTGEGVASLSAVLPNLDVVGQSSMAALEGGTP